MGRGIAEIRRAETLDPLAPAIPNALGTVLLEARRNDEAIAALNRALVWDADFVPAHQSLARLYRLTGNGDRAIAESRRALELGARTERASARGELRRGWTRGRGESRSR